MITHPHFALASFISIERKFILAYDHQAQSITARFQFKAGWDKSTDIEQEAMEMIAREFEREMNEGFLYAAIVPSLFEQIEKISRDILKRAEMETGIKFELETEGFEYRGLSWKYH